MVVDILSPSIRTTLAAGWDDPANAFASDDARTMADDATVDPDEKYGDYALNASGTLNSFKVRVEGRMNPSLVDLEVLVWDGSVWRIELAFLTAVESTNDIDFTGFVNTIAKANSKQAGLYKVRIRPQPAGSGCFPLGVEFMVLDLVAQEFKMKPVEQLAAVTDVVFGMSAGKFDASPVRQITIHPPTEQTLKRLFFKIPDRYVDVYRKSPILSRLYTLPSSGAMEGDIIATTNHPITTRNRGQVTFGEVTVGDRLGELLHENNQFSVGGVPVTRIEDVPYSGPCFDFHHDMPFAFGRYLLGHDVKL